MPLHRGGKLFISFLLSQNVQSETKSSDPLKDPTPSKPTSPDTTISSSTRDLFKKEPHDAPDT